MKVGILGTGLMGQPMALRLLADGFEVVAYNRTREKLEPIADAGGEIADSPADVMSAADCTLLMVTNADAIADLILSDSAKAALANHTIIQMSTIGPQQSQAICKDVQTAGGEYLEAPVLGSIPQVKEGTLIVMVGSTPEQFEQWQPIFQSLGSEPLHVGTVGQAAAMKLAMNQLIGSLTSAFSTSLGFVMQQGIDPEQFMAIVRQSALYAPTFDKKLQRMCDRNFSDPNFPTKHLLKDMNLFADEASAVGINTALVTAVSQIVDQAVQQGLADVDYSALFAAVYPESAIHKP